MKKRRYLPTTFGELNGLRAAAYILEANVEQGSDSGPGVQLADVEVFATRHGLTLGEVYSDLVSGSSTDGRDDFARMLRDADAGRFDALLVRDSSRLGRDEGDVSVAEDQLHDAGVVVVFTYDNVISSKSSGRHLEKSGQNVPRRDKVKRFDHGHWSGPAPIGYRMGYLDRWDPTTQATEPIETGTLIPDLVERLGATDTVYTNADLVRHLGEIYAQGKLGARPLAARLNAEGYRTPKGKKFGRASIRRIVENPVYAGFSSWHQRADERLHGQAETAPVRTHEPIWDEPLWERIQRVRNGAFHGGLNSRQMRRSDAFSRLLVCDRCSARIYAKSRTHKDRRPDTGGIERQLANLKELFVMGDLDRESYVTRSHTLKALLDDDELPARGTSADRFAQAAAHLDDLGRLWEEATDEEKNAVAAALFETVRVRDDRIVSVKLSDPALAAVIADHIRSAETVSTVAPPASPGGNRGPLVDSPATATEF